MSPEPIFSTMHLAPPLTRASPADGDDISALLQVVQTVASEVEQECGAAAVLTNLGSYQDSKHLHVHIPAGARRGNSSVEASEKQ